MFENEIDQLRDEVEALTQQRDSERRKSIGFQDRVLEAESVQEENEKLQDLLAQSRDELQVKVYLLSTLFTNSLFSKVEMGNGFTLSKSHLQIKFSLIIRP